MQWSIGKIIEKWALITPGKAALVFDGEITTYLQLEQRTNQVAHLLLAAGVAKGDRIACYCENNLDSICIYFAAAKLGLVCVPLNNRLLPAEIIYQLENSSSRIVFFDEPFADRFESVAQELAIPPSSLFQIGGEATDKQWCNLLHTELDSMSTHSPTPAEPVALTDPLAIIYTSGTTGAPKGAVTNHLQTYFKCFQIILYADMRQDDVYLTHMPLFHSAGLFGVLTPILSRGATVVTSRKFDPKRYVEDAKNFKATLMIASTTMLKMILRDYDKSSDSFAHVRSLFGGGERTPLSLIQQLQDLGLNIRMGFGQTENSFMAMQQAGEALAKVGSVGRPGFFTDIWIKNAEGQVAAKNETGSIVARGPTVMCGYWNMPEKTAETIVDGVLDTGDVGYMDEDQHVYLVDREKDMYRSGAENVYPAEIEKLLMDHPKIFNIAIIGVPDVDWGETGKAFVVLNPEETIDLEEIHQYLEGKLARYKFPRKLEILDELPLTETGKVKKAVLKSREQG